MQLREGSTNRCEADQGHSTWTAAASDDSEFGNVSSAVVWLERQHNRLCANASLI